MLNCKAVIIVYFQEGMHNDGHELKSCLTQNKFVLMHNAHYGITVQSVHILYYFDIIIDYNLSNPT